MIDTPGPFDIDLYERTLREMPNYSNPYGHTPPERIAYELAAQKAAMISADRNAIATDGRVERLREYAVRLMLLLQIGAGPQGQEFAEEAVQRLAALGLQDGDL